MSDAPERIWITHPPTTLAYGLAHVHNLTGSTKYIRADLAAANVARIAELERQLAEARDVKPLEWALREDRDDWERAATNGAILDAWKHRAEAAESENARLRDALDNLLEAISALDRHSDRALTITGPTANLKWLLEAEDDARAALTAKGEAE